MFQSLFKKNKSKLDPVLAAKVKTLQVLDLQKGQVLIVQVHESIPAEQLFQFQYALQSMIPDNQVVVCDEKFEFFKISPEDLSAMKLSKPGNT